MKKNNRGFTLAELLVAVALIGILVSVSVVIFTGRTAEAKENVCKTNRDAMQHGTVVISMTERVNWKEQYSSGGLNTQASEDIISYLLAEGYIDDFKCPAGGTIYAADVQEDLVKFKCTYHDDGMEPGSDDEWTKKKAENLREAVEMFFEDGYKAGYKNNDILLNQFLKDTDEYWEYIQKADMTDILTKDKIEDLVDKIIMLNGVDESNRDKIIKSLQLIIQSQNTIVPYYANESDMVITYFTPEKEADSLMQKGGRTHTHTNMICCNGQWYFYGRATASGIKVEYILPSVNNALKGVNSKDNASIEAALKVAGWIRVS